MGLAEIAARAPVAWGPDRVLPAVEPLARLFQERGPRRGSTLHIAGSHGTTTLALGLAAGGSDRGAWTGAVGGAGLGLLAAAELGVDLQRFAVVRAPDEHWPAAVGVLLDALDLVLAWLPPRLRADDARRLAARARERGAVLATVGGWPGPADLRLTVTAAAWTGLDQGYGRLRARALDVSAVGKGAAARERRVRWVPGSGESEVVELAVPEAG